MKKTPVLVASAIALTVVFYLAAIYLLPGPAPSGALMGLFAALALAIVFGIDWLVKRREPRKPVARDKTSKLLVWLALGAIAGLSGCQAAQRPPNTSASAPIKRLTGTAFLLQNQAEEAGYGLYSYALLAHKPSAAELPAYRAFMRAIVDLPTAAALGHYVPKERINLTSIPVTGEPPPGIDPDAEVDFILGHYDYARSSVILASLPKRTGGGPALISVLKPIDPAARPIPVLVQDLTHAQPGLMATYVANFVSQAGQDHFWQESTLGQFALSLRNSLETAAVGLGMSKTAVDSWIKYFQKS